jgi:hypothetical protein
VPLLFSNKSKIRLGTLFLGINTHTHTHTHNACSSRLYTTAMIFLPKNLLLWRDSNQRSSIPVADALPLCHAARADFPRSLTGQNENPFSELLNPFTYCMCKLF